MFLQGTINGQPICYKQCPTGQSWGTVNGVAACYGEGEGEGEGEGDSYDFGDLPGSCTGDDCGLYEPRYPDGIKGVFSDFTNRIDNTSIMRFSKSIMPTHINSGTCPSWDFDLSRMMNLGVYKVQPPCEIWPILRVVILIYSLLLARQLIFGG
jgi:hypothetical protein